MRWVSVRSRSPPAGHLPREHEPLRPDRALRVPAAAHLDRELDLDLAHPEPVALVAAPPGGDEVAPQRQQHLVQPEPLVRRLPAVLVHADDRSEAPRHRPAHRLTGSSDMDLGSRSWTSPRAPSSPSAEWQKAREELLVREKEATRAHDALAAARRRMPMEELEKDYVARRRRRARAPRRRVRGAQPADRLQVHVDRPRRAPARAARCSSTSSATPPTSTPATSRAW